MAPSRSGMSSLIRPSGPAATEEDDAEQMSEATMATAMAVVEMAGVVDGAGLEQLKVRCWCPRKDSDSP